MYFAWPDLGILAVDNSWLDTTNTENELEIKNEGEERKLHRMAKVHDMLEMWPGSLILHFIQRESHIQNKQMTAVGYISDMKEIVTASWLLFQHAGVAAFKFSERLPLPQALSTKDLPGGQTQLLNVCQMRRINDHLVENDEDSALESVSNPEI